MIQPYITYGLLIWGNAHPSILRKTVFFVQKIQYSKPHGHTTMQSNMIEIDRCYFNFSKHLPVYSMPKLWNISSKQIKQNVTRTCLKRIVKNKLLS